MWLTSFCSAYQRLAISPGTCQQMCRKVWYGFVVPLTNSSENNLTHQHISKLLSSSYRRPKRTIWSLTFVHQSLKTIIDDILFSFILTSYKIFAKMFQLCSYRSLWSKAAQKHHVKSKGEGNQTKLRARPTFPFIRNGCPLTIKTVTVRSKATSQSHHTTSFVAIVMMRDP